MLYAVHPADRRESPRRDGRDDQEPSPMTDTTVDREAEPESLAPAVTRAALILDVLAESAAEPVGPSELARRLGPPEVVDRQHLRRARRRRARAADRDGVLARPPARRARRRLPRLGRPGPGVLRRRPPLPAASDETVQFAVLDGLEVTYLARHDGRQPVRLTSGIGRRLPAFSTATGKAALASLPIDELDRRLDGLDHAAPALPQVARDGRLAARRPRRDPRARLRDRRRGDDGGRRLLRRS